MSRDEQCEIANVLRELHMEYAHCRSAWELWNAIGKTSERVDLLRGSGARFFGWVQRALVDQIILGVARMTDPAITSNKKNLSIHYVLEHADWKNESDRHRLERAVRRLQQRTDRIRAWRNKQIAHADLDARLGEAMEGPRAIDLTRCHQLIAGILNRASGTLIGDGWIHDRLDWDNDLFDLRLHLKLGQDCYNLELEAAIRENRALRLPDVP